MSKRKSYKPSARRVYRFNIEGPETREKCPHCGRRYFGKPARCGSCRRSLSHVAVLEKY